MLIGILSDSHDNVPYLNKAVGIFNQNQVSHVLHAGDFVSAFTAKPFVNLKCKFTGVFGNNDGDKLLLKDKFKDIGEIYDDVYEEIIDGRKVILFHRETLVEEVAKSKKYDIIIYGHTHKIDIREGDPLIVNPGECGGWLTGKSTVAVLDTEKMKAEIIELK
ncbi:MAG: metallophosphoesterase [Candidatus Ratteibacteria bacterium]|nr:metallophosphoesterase [Candidatus Ratteibacteria bacterium]